MKRVRVLGVDPGTVVTGFGVIDQRGNALAHVHSGVIRPGRSGPMHERLAMIHRGVDELIREYHPDVMAVEEAFYRENPKTAIKLGQARGVILVLGALHGLEVAEYSPRFVKQAVVGTGGATKEQVQYMVARVLSLREVPQPSDIADALAIALCHALRPGDLGPDATRPGAEAPTKAQRQLRELGVR